MPHVLGEDADAFVEAGGDELAASGGVVHVQHRGHVVHVDRDGLLQVPHVVRVQATGKQGSLIHLVGRIRTEEEVIYIDAGVAFNMGTRL